MKRSTALTASIVAVISLGAGQASGAGPTPVVCGQVITQSIHVGNDLLNCPADGLIIGADNIKVDLGNHVIDGDGINAPTDDGIDNTGGFDNVKLTHGTVQQFAQGVRLVGATENKVEHLTVLQTTRGIVLQTLSNANKISHNKVSGNFDGIHLTDSDTNKIDHNDVFDNRIGIEFFNTDSSFLTKNKIKSNTLDGIHTFIGSTGNMLVKNHSDKNGDDGIDVADAGNTITKNHAGKNTDLGIVAVPGNVDGGGNKAHHNGNPAQCLGVTCH